MGEERERASCERDMCTVINQDECGVRKGEPTISQDTERHH